MPAKFLGQNTACSNAKAKKLLGWKPKISRRSNLGNCKKYD
ncbi:protein of unknown function [Clostridium beijerinckii]|nr:protein of unknown function [Clostridium beijerinckii]